MPAQAAAPAIPGASQWNDAVASSTPPIVIARTLGAHWDPISDALARSGLSFTLAEGGRSAIDRARDLGASVLVVHAIFPTMPAATLCAAVHGDPALLGLGILAVGAHTARLRRDWVEAGADDCIAAGASPKEVATRVLSLARRAAQIRRSNGWLPYHRVLRWGDLSVDVAAREARTASSPLHLRRLEFRLLATLLGSPGVIFTRDDLTRVIWGAAGSSRTVDTTVRRLRMALGVHASALETVQGLGYRWASGGEPSSLDSPAPRPSEIRLTDPNSPEGEDACSEVRVAAAPVNPDG